LNFALIPDWGIAGASVSSSITYALITLAFVVTISHRAALPPSELLFLKRSDITAVRHRLTKLFKSMGSS
jgi:O-antigen/teichoic acid export membrane protein